MYGLRHEIEGLEEKVTELENEREEVGSVISDVLDSLYNTDPDDIDSLTDGICEAVKLLEQLSKELR